jgi:hypothetical protein
MSARPVLGRNLELENNDEKRSERWRPSVYAIVGGSLSGLGVPERWFFQIPNCAHYQAQFRFIEYTFSPFQVKKEHYLAVKGGLSKVGDLGVAD